MKDITDLVQRYRLALRGIWDESFFSDPELRTWESVEAFRKLKLPMFQALIAHPLGLYSATNLFGPGFEVVTDSGGEMLVSKLIPSSPDGGGVCEPLRGPFAPDAFKATLLDFLDWVPLDYIDFRYYLVRIDEFPAHPTRVGHHALIDTFFSRVYRREESQTTTGDA
jgi:hypothetical protein